MKWTEIPQVRRLRARSRVADLIARTLEGYRNHRSGRNVALISHFGFLSVFPLMLVFTTVLGYVLQGNDELRTRIIDSALAQLPFVGQQIKTDPSQLHGDALVLIIGLAVSLWSGMKAFLAVHRALDDIDELPLDDRSNLFITRLRALFGILYVGGAQVGAAIFASLATVAHTAGLSTVLLTIGTVAINAGVLALSYRWLRTRSPSWREIAPGAIAGGVVFAILQLLGVAIVGRAIARATPVYGDLAAVIGLLTWLSLHALIA
ncbi:MAG TPA: YihY/virulence factor BrkB family protein, partial [Ilumatobacteraceae bacterium]|nr:YihY/virulence factor BrkB family protein [Ilumatobacteraceae bacterium]